MIQRTSSLPSQRGAFTLIELLVVLAIAAVISAVTLGGFKEMREGNKRVSCSANLTQLYQATRLYAADEGGKFPPYETDCTSTTSGIGLWALYTFSDGNNANEITPVGQRPIERYIRSSKVLHCPADLVNDQLYKNPIDKDIYEPKFLSYQACDGSTPTYSSVRVGPTNMADPLWQRQLVHLKPDGLDLDTDPDIVKRLPTDNTIVTYCMHHRGDRGMDNVLFYDGSIQLLPEEQANPDNIIAPPASTTPILIGWQRKPKAPQ